MTLVWGIVLLLAAAFAIGHPFLGGLRRMGGVGRRSGGEYRENEIGYDMRRELESDYRSGILSREEFEEQDGRLGLAGEDAAVSPATGRPEPAYDEIEARVKAIRLRNADVRRQSGASVGRGEGAGDGKAALVRPPPQGKTGVCPACGQTYREDDRFCRSCGKRLRGGGGR
jgi:hypothetical protein